MTSSTQVLELPRLVSVSDAAGALGVSIYIAERLPVRRFRLGRSTFLAADDLEQLFGAASPPVDQPTPVPGDTAPGRGR